MSRRFLKSLVVSFVSLTLLYYSAVWAMLRCLHDDDHSTAPVEIAETGAHAGVSHSAFSSHDPRKLECIGFNYHAESLAGPSSSFQLQRWSARIIAHVTDFSILATIAAGGVRGVWLGTVFNGLSSPVFRIDLPRYLSLSVLRI
jgi:hypothetical protein